MSSKKHLSVLFLAVYLLFVFYITLFSRSSSLLRTCRLELFWSYLEWMRGNARLGREILLNIALFVPLGYFLCNVLQNWRKRKFIFLAVGISFLITAAIEAIQYFDGRGLCEVDDVFNNVLGACIGAGVYTLCVRCCGTVLLTQAKLALSCLFLAAGVVGCNMAPVPSTFSPVGVMKQFDFDITQAVLEGSSLSLQGFCYAYDRDTPDYQLMLKDERTGRLYKAVTSVSGKMFRAIVEDVPDGKLEAVVTFKGIQPVSTFAYIDREQVSYVSGPVKEPDIQGTDLAMLVNNGVLKAYAPDYDVYVYQFNDTLYWLIGSPVDRTTEIIFHLHTNEPDKLPARHKKNKFDNRGFRSGAKNEITRTMRCGKYRVFERKIPKEYNITSVTVGFNTKGKIKWTRYFRVKREGNSFI